MSFLRPGTLPPDSDSNNVVVENATLTFVGPVFQGAMRQQRVGGEFLSPFELSFRSLTVANHIVPPREDSLTPGCAKPFFASAPWRRIGMTPRR
jgi:hypothetical protein